jgi:hypothetical protein
MELNLYPHAIQPRFGAFLLARGLPVNPGADLPRGWQADFLAWVGEAKRWALSNSHGGIEKRSSGELYVANHEAFTRSCWDFARSSRKEA